VQLEKMGRFLRIRAGKDLDDQIKNGLLEEKLIATFLEEEVLSLYSNLPEREGKAASYSETCMVKIAKKEVETATKIIQMIRDKKDGEL